MILRSAFLALAATVLLAQPAAAKEPPTACGMPAMIEESASSGQHGAGTNCTIIPVTDLAPREHSDFIHLRVPGYLEAASSQQAFVHTSLHLEPGIEVTRLCARAYDTDAKHELVVMMGGFESGDGEIAPSAVTLASISTGVPATPGYALLCADLQPPVLIRTTGDLNNDGVSGTLQYWVGAQIPACEVMAGPIMLAWRRAVSPPPAMATFPDVPTDHRYFRFIEALAAAGVTAGCGDGLYCPDDAITRGEIAVFLASALSLYWSN